jgi:hypothetical protein
MKCIVIDLDLANALLAYLQERPFRETAGFIQKLIALPPVEVLDSEPEPATET